MHNKLTFEIHPRSSYLDIIYAGVIDDMEAALQCFRISLQQAKDDKKNGILADLTQIDYTPLSAIDRILYFQSAAEIYQHFLSSGGNPVRLAILQGQQAQNNYTPGIDTAVENGMDCQIFYDRSAALSWLGSS